MDISFDQFGGGGWGDHGEQELAASQVQKSLFDKIPIPASLDALISMNGDVEKYPLGSYSFNTVFFKIFFSLIPLSYQIRIMGKIVNVASDTNQCTTYELCDALASDTRIAKRFTVIQYNPAEMVRIFISIIFCSFILSRNTKRKKFLPLIKWYK